MRHLAWWLSVMTLCTGLKQQHSASDDTIGQNKEEAQFWAVFPLFSLLFP